MTPSRFVFNQQAILLAADPASLALVAPLKLHLAASPFVPSLDLDPTTITEATFPGYAPLLAGAPPHKHYYDAATGMLTIEINEPAGGWHWDCTADPPSSQSIPGAFLRDGAGTILMGSFLLPAPVSISKGGQGLDIANVQLRFLQNSPN